jgi:hypothetical protein
VLLVWLYMTYIVVTLVQLTLYYDRTWIGPFLSEASTLIFVISRRLRLRSTVSTERSRGVGVCGTFLTKGGEPSVIHQQQQLAANRGGDKTSALPRRTCGGRRWG